MKERTISKPVLDTSQALKFATETIKTENVGDTIGKKRKSSHDAINRSGQSRVFFAPEGDKRLTINIREDLHKRLKITAINHDLTVGEIIEQLVEKHL